MQTADLATPTLHWNAQATQPAMTQPTDDPDLIRRLQTGDETAVRELYAQYGQRLYAYALRLTNDPSTAEDVAQQTLVTAWQSAPKYRGQGRLIAWLLGIVHHTAMKSIRSTNPYLDEVADETTAADQPSPEEHAQVRETKRWVREGLRSLSPDHRAVLELIFYQGLSLNEAADVLECPVGTVKSRLSYARRQLKGALSRSEENLP